MNSASNTPENLSCQTLFRQDIIVAVSSQWHTFPQRFDWITANRFAMAYTPNAQQLEDTRKHVIPYLERGIPVRHHGFFPKFDLGDADRLKAEEALDLHCRAVDAMLDLGEQLMTVHIGLIPKMAISFEHARDNLSRLVDYAGKRGVTIALENLKAGFAADPETIVRLSEKSGSSITLDVGHAVSCKRVSEGELTVQAIINLFAPALEEVHFYEYETDTHHPPKDMSILGPIVDALCTTNCRWWTIELGDYEDILFTKGLVDRYLMEQ